MSDRRVAAPGQYLGFSLQSTRMLEALLELGPGYTVSIEVLGDVAAEGADGSVLVEEDKSRVSGANPVADRARDFWKTLANWVSAAELGLVDPAVTKFRLHLAQPFQAGPLVEALTAASEPLSAQRALRGAEAELWGERPKHSKKGEVPESLGRFLDIVFQAEPVLVEQVIANFSVHAAETLSVDSLRSALQQTLVPGDLIEDVLHHLLGWIKDRTDTQIEQGRPARVSFSELHEEATSLITRLNWRHLLTSFAGSPAPEDVATHLRARVYVRQLELIEESDDAKMRAVTDYLLAKSDRIEWAERGWVHSASFEELADNLLAAWGSYKTRVEITAAGRSESEFGRLLYADCCLHRTTLQGLSTPEHFVRGSFHALADDKSVGWHPRFEALLEMKNGEE